jgi:branched-chain amino acid transport system permease protein
MLFLEYLISGLLFGSTYSIVAIGFTLIFGVLDRLNIAYGATLMVSAFAGAYVSLRFGGSDSYAVLALAFLTSTLVGGLLGYFIRLFAFAPLRGASHLAPFVTSAAITIALEEVFVLLSRKIPIFSPEFTAFPSPIENGIIFLGPILIRTAYIVIFLVSVCLLLILHWWINHSSTGRAIRAVEENADMAWLLGINVKRIEITVFVVASAIAGAAGCLIGVAQGMVESFMGSNMLLVSFVIIVLAGLGSLKGAMICGLLVGTIEVMMVGLVSASMKEAVLFVILFVTLLIRPQGIFGGTLQERD